MDAPKRLPVRESLRRSKEIMAQMAVDGLRQLFRSHPFCDVGLYVRPTSDEHGVGHIMPSVEPLNAPWIRLTPDMGTTPVSCHSNWSTVPFSAMVGIIMCITRDIDTGPKAYQLPFSHLNIGDDFFIDDPRGHLNPACFKVAPRKYKDHRHVVTLLRSVKTPVWRFNSGHEF